MFDVFASRRASRRVTRILGRREVVFLHVTKTAGSSFWHSLARELNCAGGFGVDDAYARSFEQCGDASGQVEAVIRIVNDFEHADLKKLVLHYHSELNESGPITSVLPNAGYVTLYRNAEDRMRSGFRHWVAKNNVSPRDSMMRFWGDPFSFGFCRVAPFVFGMGGDGNVPSDSLIRFYENNVVAISFEEFISESRRMQLVSNAMEVRRIEPINLVETQTLPSINIFLDEVLQTNAEFADKWRREVEMESRWIGRLFENTG